MKVLEGQLEFLQMVSDLTKSDHSLAGEIIQIHVDNLVKDQAVAPDVVKNTVAITPDIDGDTGKLVKFKA